MRKLHIILLEEPLKNGTPEDTLVVYVSRHGNSRNDALLRMHMQGILPKFSVVSHTIVPAYKTLFMMWFPSMQVINHHYGKLNIWTWLKYWIALPLSKLFKGSNRKNWQQLGEYDAKTKRIYPLPDGERMSE